MGTNGNFEGYVQEVAERSVRNETRLDSLEPRVARLESAFLKVIFAAAGGGGIAGLLARLLG